MLLKIPKSELHVHLRGAMPIELFAHLLTKYPVQEILRQMPESFRKKIEECGNIRPLLTSKNLTYDKAGNIFQYKNFEEFLITYSFTSFFVRCAEDFQNLVAGVVSRLKSQNIVYAEITVSLGEYLKKKSISLSDAKDCFDQASRISGIRVQWIVDLVRDYGVEGTLSLLKDIIKLQCTNIIGITLGGSEHLFPPDQFREIYSMARNNGLCLSIHAGEALGPKSVWDALNILKAQRIGHGIRAVEDKALVEYLAKNRIALEVCPTSNIQTGVVKSYDEHPVREFIDAGVPVTINTDDPTFFKTTLVNEYMHLYSMGVSKEDILNTVRNGFRYAFLPQDDIKEYLNNVESHISNWKRVPSFW